MPPFVAERVVPAQRLGQLARFADQLRIEVDGRSVAASCRS
jgi:hypothetical protein